MVLVQALLAAIFRSAGRLLNTVFGWATVLLFGRVPQDRQIYLSLISFGSVAWLIALVGIAFPKIGTFLLGGEDVVGGAGSGEGLEHPTNLVADSLLHSETDEE